MSDAPPPSPPSPPQSGPPEYKVYRSRRRLRDRFAPAGSSPLDALRKRRTGRDQPSAPQRGRVTPRRVLKWVALAILAWILLAIVVFFISAQTAPGVSDRTREALDGGSAVLAGSTILVLGSDRRPKGTKEPGANQGPPRADSIMLLHVGFGSVRKLSILRDTVVDIPGHGSGKVNSAYAIGGAPLMIETLKRFFGSDLRINHLIEVSFSDFPNLIDALGGVDIKLKKCVISNRFGGKRVRLRRGEHHLNGQQALRFARVRENRCAPNEDDRARAARQQQVLGAMRNKIASPLHWPSSFFRAPLISWQAPRAIRSDMHGPGIGALFIDLLTGGTGKTQVLEFDTADAEGVRVSDVAKADALHRLLGK